MKCDFSFIYKSILFIFLSIMSVGALSKNETVKAEQCTLIKSNISRLACFDKVFNTPVGTQILDDRLIANIIPRLVSDIFILAKNDTNDSQENNLEVALSSNDERAAIYITCKDNITRFQLALDQPINQNMLNVHIANNDTNKIVSKIDWQSAERGYMLDSGRGLYAIQQLKSILYIDSFTVTLPQENKSFIFKNNGLASRVASIRKECGW
ncbi:type VI secretion system-associated protein TagO [Rodentibacter pneumotropicus]|uniref:Type VI secretion protein n=2 Tax=Rodentibacter pneumotropicus TaxID=758 RepID=A0A4S2Q6E5_9PAST|nr:type VI secretion system-associated protein TagO [Rodentibacter pneumotropicus]MDC2826600.1 type VI secretion system-associated protein TagO [Rodentibacter pneumotropicus]TGZ98078.1 type VI secretion protein [Rodentibacter pneumotropicus]THA03940.1 type VI secretion protein [Rodentibacter pneumotropicus]THA08601.1 type VI secretion protein [Rodentibacter pneumotropicus]THA12252.1 type VI secretion protein [Rodentibacter pneumotropicus]